MASKRANRILNATRPKPIKMPSETPLGSPGYDNPRDDIEKVKKLREGSVEKVPVLDNDIANKEYVDSQTRHEINLFLTNNASDIADYKDLETDVVTAAEESIVQSITAGSTTLIASFVSILNEEEIDNITLLESGVYACHLHAEGQVSNKLFAFCEFHKRTAAGAETLIGTSHDSPELPTSQSEVDMHVTISSDTAWVSGDRFVIKIYGRNNGGADKNVILYMEGETAARAEFPGFIPPTFVASHASTHEVGGSDLVDHDNLTNFVSNEHIDWTADVSPTVIHANNYVDNDTTDHTALSNIGTNTHPQIDTHLALVNPHIDWETASQGTIHASNYVDNDNQLSNEEVQDIAGPLVATGGTKTGIAITYQDGTNDIDFIVDHDGGINFVANEHLDWTQDLGATNLHAGNLALIAGDGIDVSGATITAETATATNPGIAELATEDEVQTGTDTGRVVTPDTLQTIAPPIGSVIAWLKSFTNTPQTLPTGWVECGTTVSDADSVYNGQTMPPAPGDNQFLRANTTSGGTGGESTHVLTKSEMPSHTHVYTAQAVGSAGGITANGANSLASTSSVGGDAAHENKPPFYDVVWIVRIK